MSGDTTELHPAYRAATRRAKWYAPAARGGLNAAIKCHLSARPGLCTGFLEGQFVRFYQQSLFTWNNHATAPLRVTGQQVKKMNNAWVLSGGLPLEAFRHYYPEAEMVEGMVTLSLDCDDTEYASWYRGRVADLIATQVARQGEVCGEAASHLTVTLLPSVVQVIETWSLTGSSGADTEQLIHHLRHAIASARGAS